MKIAFVVLLLAAVVFAAEIDRGNRARRGSRDGLNCVTGEDCEGVCDWQCYNSVDAMCIDGSCYCELQPVDRKKDPPRKQ